MKLLKILLIVSFVLVIAVVVYSQLYSTVTVDASNYERNPNMRVLIDNSDLSPEGNGGNTYIGRVRPGNHTVTVSHPLYEEYSSEQNTKLFTDTKLKPDTKKISAQSVANTLSANENVIISEAEFHANSTWLTYFINSAVAPGDGSIVLANYSPTGNMWVIISEGTAFDIFDSSTEIPDEVMDYLESI